jgi:hypothetical protein
MKYKREKKNRKCIYFVTKFIKSCFCYNVTGLLIPVLSLSPWIWQFKVARMMVRKKNGITLGFALPWILLSNISFLCYTNTIYFYLFTFFFFFSPLFSSSFFTSTQDAIFYLPNKRYYLFLSTSKGKDKRTIKAYNKLLKKKSFLFTPYLFRLFHNSNYG